MIITVSTNFREIKTEGVSDEWKTWIPTGNLFTIFYETGNPGDPIIDTPEMKAFLEAFSNLYRKVNPEKSNEKKEVSKQKWQPTKEEYDEIKKRHNL